jgi:methionyl-tRNA formyltransferase
MAEKFQALRIVFMGTPEFAVASLDALVKAGCNIVGVVTAPDKPAGRGMRMTESAVKKYAVEHHLKVLQPEKLKNPGFIEELRLLKANLQVVVAFRMLPESVWNMPPMGTINVHGSLLPQYRGAAPINRAVINGEKETGVTTFQLKHEIDTGNILLQESFPIGEDETAGEVHDKMKKIGADLLLKTVKGLADGSLYEQPQSEIAQHKTLHHAPKIFTETCRIDFSKTVEEVHNLIRGLSPFPCAFTELNGKMLKVYRSKKELSRDAASDLNPKSKLNPENKFVQAGHTVPTSGYKTDGKTYLKFACSNGYIHVLELQLEGKKRMMVDEFLRGYRFGSERSERPEP